MKRLIVILITVLLLCGCGAPASEDAAAPETEAATQAPTQAALVSLYDADSDVEKQTSGAVRTYPLGDGVYTDLLIMGENLLVVSETGDITMLQGDLGQIAATEATDLEPERSELALRVSDQGLGYYTSQTGEVVLLDKDLLEIARIQMPEDSTGVPAILLLRNEIFYCTGNEIRAMDIQTGISRLVRSHSCASQELTGSYFNDTILGCRITDDQGAQKVIYLYAETGEVVAEDPTLGTLYTREMDYFALRSDGTQTQILFGNADSETMCLETEAEGISSALALGGAVRTAVQETGLTLEFYDFATGTRSAEVTLEGLGAPTAMAADQTALWFIIDQTLYRWDLSLSQTQETASYAALLYTQQNPDTQGLAQCQSRVEQLSAQYGVTLQIWKDAVADTGDHDCQPEYRVNMLTKALDEIEKILAALPENFLATTGNLRFALVRSVDGGQNPGQYWESGTCHVMVPADSAEFAFLWGLGYAIDARVLGNSRDFDDWDDLNPNSFEYTYDYAENEAREDAEDYLDDFVDQTAMSFPTEDRARTFAAAVQAGNEELFAQDTLQDKLLCLCKGIREAYNAEDVAQVFPWEQYLEEPLAPEE